MIQFGYDEFGDDFILVDLNIQPHQARIVIKQLKNYNTIRMVCKISIYEFYEQRVEQNGSKIVCTLE